MLGWFYIAIEHWARASSSRLDAVCPHVPLWFVRRVSEAKLVRTLRYVWRQSVFQRERWQEAGVRRGDLRSARVLSRIPFLSGKDLALHPERYFCVAPEELIHAVGSSGATGQHKVIYLTQEDFARQVRMLGTFYRRFPGVKRAVTMMSLDDPAWSAGAITRRGFEEARLFGMAANTSRDIEAQAALLREHRFDLIQSTPPYVHRLALESPFPVRELGVKYLIVAGQPFTEDWRREMEAAWGAKVIDSYGGAETACGIGSECALQENLHVAEADYWVEVVDPETGKPLEDGQDGEFVITTLSRKGMPLVRYRSADLAALIPRAERCSCGLPLRKMSRVRGRVDDMFIVGTGANVFPDEVDRAVFSVPGVADYQLVIRKDTYRDALSLTVECVGHPDGLDRRLLDALMTIHSFSKSYRLTKTLIVDRIEVVAPGALAAGRPKSRRIVDRRA